MDEKQARLVASLIASISPDYEPPRWHLANPYMLRHLVEHADAAGLLDELLQDPEFLVYARPSALEIALSRGTSRTARINAAIWRTSVVHHRVADPSVRRQILSLDAARFNVAELSRRLAQPPWPTPQLAWRPLWSTGAQVTYSLLNVFGGHDDSVLAVAMIETGGRLLAASGSLDRTVRAWDVQTGEPVCKPLVGHSGPVSAIALCLVGSHPIAVSGSADGTIRRWDLTNGASLDPVGIGHNGTIIAIRTSTFGDQAIAVSVARDSHLRCWNLETGNLVRTIAIGRAPINDLAIVGSTTTPALVTAGQDGTIRLWRLAEQSDIPTLIAEQSSPVRTVDAGVFDGRTVIFSASDDRRVRIFDLDGRLVRNVPFGDHQNEIRWLRVALHQQRSTIVTASGLDVGVCDAVLGWYYLPGHDREVLQVATATLNGQGVALSGGADRTLRAWRLDSPMPLSQSLQGHRKTIRSTAIGTFRGRIVVASCGGNTILVHYLDDGVVLREVDTDCGSITAVQLGELNCRAVVWGASQDRVVRMWDLDTGEPGGRPLVGHTGWIASIAVLNLDGRRVAITGGNDRMIRVWDALSGQPVRPPLEVGFGWTSALTATTVSSHPIIVAAGNDGTLRRWDLTSKTETPDLVVRHSGALRAIAIGTVRACQVAISIGIDGAVRQFGLADLRPLGEPLYGGGGLSCVGIGKLDDQDVLAAGNDSGVVTLWDCVTSERLASLRFPHPIAGTHLVNGSQLVVAFGRDLTVLTP